jgi:hypothetical protein
MLAVTLIGLAAGSSAVFFSPAQLLGQGYRELPMPVDKLTLEATVDGLLGRPVSGTPLINAEAPHVVVLQSAAGAADLSNVVQSAGSAVGLPYTAGEPTDLADAKVVQSGEELDQLLKGGLPKLLVVRSPDALSFISKLNAVTTNYVGLAFSAPAEQRSLAELAEKKSKDKAMAEPVLILMTPSILTGLMTGVLWLTIFFSGVCCLFQLATPDRFEDKVLNLNKEY